MGNSVGYSFRVTQVKWQRIRDAALRADLTIAAWLRRAVDQQLEREAQ